MTASLKGRAAALPLALALSGAAFVHLLCAVSPFDDAYIIFRYVENFSLGRGAVYNAGERVFGISCPLYAAWLAALHAAVPGVSLGALAVRGNLVFLAFAAALAYRLCRRVGVSALASSIAAGALAVSEGILRASIGGMESTLFLALLFGALLASMGRRDAIAFLLASLATLARPEGSVLLAVVIACRYLDPITRTRGLRPWLGLTPLLVWAVAATAFYGTPIPHSVIAKSRPLYPLPVGAALGHLAAQTGRWTLGGALAVWPAIVPIVPAAASRPASGLFVLGMLGLVAGCALTLWAVARWWRRTVPARSPRALALPAYLVLLIVFYAITNPLLLPWYLPLVQGPWIVLVVAAMSLPGGTAWPVRALRAAALVLVLSTALASFVLRVGSSDRSLLRYGATDARQARQLAVYARAAEWIAAHSDPSDSVAAPEIGVLGYRLDRRILDACGLVTPEALPFLPVPPEQRGTQLGPISVDFVKATRPDMMATLPAFAEKSLLRSDWFAAGYELVHEEPLLPDEPRYRAVLIYRRRQPDGDVR